MSFVIRNTNDHDEFFAQDTGWTFREYADEFADKTFPLPEGGEWVHRYAGLTFKIVRKHKDRKIEDIEIKTDLTYEEAREHCSDPSTQAPDLAWFEAFYEE